MKVPFDKIFYTGKEMEFITDALKRKFLSGDGYYTGLVSSLLKERFNINKVFMTTSGTHALELAVRLLNLESGTEVIMPSFTFPSTANAVMMMGLKPVFVEIREDTLNINPVDIQKKITRRTGAIIPVHYAGIACQMDKINRIAKDNKLYVLEDAAQAVNARYQGKYLGSWGDIGCYSFHSTKNYISGEGGAIAINLKDGFLIERAEVIRENGTNRAKFIRGDIDRYSWVEQGSSYLPSDLLMALLYAQLSQLDYIQSRRKVIHDFYSKNLEQYSSSAIKSMTFVPDDCDPNYHCFFLVFENRLIRDRVMIGLQKRDISAVSHYSPLHSSPMGKKLGYQPEDLPVTENISKCLLRLPMYTGMTEQEMEFVVEKLIEVLGEL